MPALKTTVPKLSRHSDGKNAIVRIDGQVIYLGRYDSQSARAQYDLLIAQWLAGGRRLPQTAEALSVNQLVVGYLTHADAYYRKNGELTREYGLIKEAVAVLVQLYGDTAVPEFGPLRLKSVRELMIQRGWSRKYINKQVGRLVRCFRWGVEEELLPETTYRALKAISGLKKGRCDANEYPPVPPVAPNVVQLTIKELSRVVADMVQFQLLTGCRPGEVCALGRNYLDRTENVWIYTPPDHKTEHQNQARRIYIGPKAQGIVATYLMKVYNRFAFSPQDSVAEFRDQRMKSRQTPIHYGNRPGTNRVKNPQRIAKNRYTTDSYRRAIHRACDRAFPTPSGLDERQEKEWRSRHRWSPNQLRHSSATWVRAQFGLEAAQVILGHANADVTQLYAERNEQLAMEVMQKIG